MKNLCKISLVVAIMLLCVPLLTACGEENLYDKYGGVAVKYYCDESDIDTIATAMQNALNTDKYTLVVLTKTQDAQIVAQAPTTNDAKYKNYPWVDMLDEIASAHGISHGMVDVVAPARK